MRGSLDKATASIFPGFEPFFFNLLVFLIYLFIFFNLLKGLCQGFLFLHKSRSPRTPLITLRVNSFFTALAQCSPLLLLVADPV